MKGTAYFVKYPSRKEDLLRPHLLEDRRAYEIVKTINLRAIDYKNFITDLRIEREYLEDNASLCSEDSAGVCHCILVKQQEGSDGVLVVPDACGYVIWAAYLHELD